MSNLIIINYPSLQLLRYTTVILDSVNIYLHINIYTYINIYMYQPFLLLYHLFSLFSSGKMSPGIRMNE